MCRIKQRSFPTVDLVRFCHCKWRNNFAKWESARTREYNQRSNITGLCKWSYKLERGWKEGGTNNTLTRCRTRTSTCNYDTLAACLVHLSFQLVIHTNYRQRKQIKLTKTRTANRILFRVSICLFRLVHGNLYRWCTQHTSTQPQCIALCRFFFLFLITFSPLIIKYYNKPSASQFSSNKDAHLHLQHNKINIICF